eukprot:COSAG01_NODE_2405_length_7756_cov_2.156589_6_plen_325_part_00
METAGSRRAHVRLGPATPPRTELGAARRPSPPPPSARSRRPRACARARRASKPRAAAAPVMDAPCTRCLRHGDLSHARKALTAAAAAGAGVDCSGGASAERANAASSRPRPTRVASTTQGQTRCRQHVHAHPQHVQHRGGVGGSSSGSLPLSSISANCRPQPTATATATAHATPWLSRGCHPGAAPRQDGSAHRVLAVALATLRPVALLLLAPRDLNRATELADLLLQRIDALLRLPDLRNRGARVRAAAAIAAGGRGGRATTSRTWISKVVQSTGMQPSQLRLGTKCHWSESEVFFESRAKSPLPCIPDWMHVTTTWKNGPRL